jgi:hypothetical protein
LYSQKAGAVAGSEKVGSFFNMYLFGPVGYDGSPMTWTRAGIRIAAAAVIGLLPLLGLYVWQFSRTIAKHGAASVLSLLPVMSAIIAVGAMRNYFAQHPWMAPPIFIVGIVLAMRLLQTPHFMRSRPSPLPRLEMRYADFLIVGLSVAYGCLISALTSVNMGQDKLIHLVKSNTQRSEHVAFSPHRDPWMVREEPRLEELCDREFVNWDSGEAGSELKNRPQYLLTAVEYPPPIKWKSKTTDGYNAMGAVVGKLLRAYHVLIARRKRGDRMEAPACYLYDIGQVSFSTNDTRSFRETAPEAPNSRRL